MAKQLNGEVRFASRAEEEAQGIALAERLGLPYVDLASFRVDPDLFRSVPVEWMLRFSFVPESRTDKVMAIICADPTDVVRLDAPFWVTVLPGFGTPLRSCFPAPSRSPTGTTSKNVFAQLPRRFMDRPTLRQNRGPNSVTTNSTRKMSTRSSRH